MPTIADNFVGSRAFCQAVHNADKYSPSDIPYLRSYFVSKQGSSTFLFQWLDKLERGGLTRDQVLTVVHGMNEEEHEKNPTSPKKRKYTRRAKTPPPTDDDQTPGVTPMASPNRPPKKRVTEESPSPVTPKVSRRKRTAPPRPPSKNPRTSKKETQVINDSDEDLNDSDEDEDESEDDDQFEAVRTPQ